ncbi:phosphatase PAP2 family protein [Halobacteriovorax sp.]|uniref:phosphatase PAP2 family protein n=1 Tax=Halobacteriovorax sp. TaxID=2020862 RepID=UPI003AF268E8
MLFIKSTFFKRVLILFFFLIYNPVSSRANECGWLLSDFTSPVCTDAKYIFWTGTTITAGLRLLKQIKGFDEIQRRAVAKNHLKGLGEFGGDIGYGYLNGTYILGNYLLGGARGAKKASHMLQATFYTVGTTVALKSMIHETRPGYPQEHDSFPSGHTSASFAFASVVLAQDGVVWGSLAHLAAIFISFSRINDEWHYLHDVTAGMTIGMSYAWGIYFNNMDYGKPYWFTVLPTENLDGLSIGYALSF